MRTLATLFVLGLLSCLPTTALAEDATEVTMNVQDVDVRKVFEALATFGKKNIIISPEVKGKVSVSFEDTPWDKAMESVAQACHCDVVDTGNGIFTITPKARKQAARLAELVAKSERRLVELEADRAAAKSEKQAVLVLQIHSIADLLQAKVDALTLARNAVGEANAQVEQQKQVLIVRASGAGQQRLAERLSQVRVLLSRYGAKHHALVSLVNKDVKPSERAGYFWVAGKAGAGGKAGEAGKPGTAGRWVKVKEGEYREVTPTGKKSDLVTTERGRFKLKRLPAKEYPMVRGRVVTTTGESVKGEVVLLAPPSKQEWWAAQDAKIKVLRGQAEKLKKAAALLREAGDLQGAKRALEQLKIAEKKITGLRRQATQRTVSGVTLSTNGPLRDSRIEHSINALRKEVKGLRSDVRELTQLVKQLLNQRRRPPARK